MKVIHKYDIFGQGQTEMELPANATPLTFGWQRGRYILWVLLDPDADRVWRAFYAAETGEEVPSDLGFIGTVERAGYVLHLFEVAPSDE